MDQQNVYGQNLQHNFEVLALADNVISLLFCNPRKTLIVKTGTGTMNPYADYSGVSHVTASGQVNPYVQGHGDLFYTPQQNYHMPVSIEPSFLEIQL